MLHITQATVYAIGRVQFVMRTAFDYLAVLHNQYEIRMADGGKTVRYRKNRTILHQIGKRILHKAFRDRIKRTRGLIKNENRRIAQYCTGDSNTLTFAA